MPFESIDIKTTITHECEKDNKFKEAYNEMMVEYELISKVVKARKEKGLTQESLAKAIGVKQQEISRFENRKHMPTLTNLVKILDGVGLQLNIESKQSKQKIKCK